MGRLTVLIHFFFFFFFIVFVVFSLTFLAQKAMRRSVFPFLKIGGSVVHCDGEEAKSQPTILEAADMELQNQIRRVKTPQPYDDFSMMVAQGGAVHTFDGMRLQVQKQVNLNSVVSHFFWLGSQVVNQPIYQYSLILVDDDKMLKVSTDMDFNIETDGKMPLGMDGRLVGKVNAMISDQQGQKLQVDATYSGDDWIGQLLFGRPENSIGCTYLQSITPSITLGGLCQYDPSDGSVAKEFCGMYDDGENMIAGSKSAKQTKVCYRRTVNPNRVVLSTDLVFDESMNSAMTVSAQYSLKQSTLNFGVDSNLLIKSMVSSELAPGVSLQFCGEVQHASDHYRFGYGLTMGS